jgi:hypothetical protein
MLVILFKTLLFASCAIIFLLLGCETVEVLAVIKALLLSNRRMRAFMIPPLFRLHPTGFKDDIAVCVVISHLILAFTYHPALSSINKNFFT